MDATQQIEDSFFGEEDDSGDEHDLAELKSQREPLAVLKVFKNNHIPETEVPLYQGENILGRDPTSCSVPLQARSISGRHAIISISVFGPNDRRGHSEETEALLWDLGSLNGTRKGRLKLNPHVRYALTEGDSVVFADLPCQYVSLKNTEKNTHTSTTEKTKRPTSSSSSAEGETEKRVENGRKKSALPPVPVWSDEEKRLQTAPKQPETTLVPESDSDSDGEKHGRKERRRIVASESASSDLSSPTSSTFLTPANKIIPESEDESSITPSPALKGRFQKTGNDTEVSSDSSKPDPLHFNIDSDTDDEDDDVGMTKATPAIEAAVTAEMAAVNPADLNMDSDTDVEEEGVEKVKSDPDAPAKQDLVNPAALTMDSDTDVEENEPVKADTASLSGPVDALEVKKDTASSAQIHLESDTDVEDEDVPHIQDSRPPSSRVAELNMNSDTDVEEDEELTKAIEPVCDTDRKHLVKQAGDFPDAKTLRHESDSDTDVEDDFTKIRTPTVVKETGKEGQTAGEYRPDTQHDSPVRVQPPVEALRDDFRLDSDTDVEEDEDETQEKEQKCAEGAVQIVQSSTPIGAGLSEEEKETQVFLNPSQLFKRPGLPSLLHPSVSPGGVSLTDDDFTVAETQSFVCDAARADATLDETPQLLDDPEPQRSAGASSFQLDLSDSSHQPAEAEEHNQEPGEEDWQLQATQLYAMKNSEGSTKAGQTQLDLDATQAYTDSISHEEVKDEGKDEEEDETQPRAAPCYSNIHIAETQLIEPGAQNEDPNDRDSNEKVSAGEPERKEEEEVQADSHLSTADTLLIIRSPRQEEQTQPYAFLAEIIQKERESKDEERDEGQGAQNETNDSVGQENDGREIKGTGRMVMETKNGVTGDSAEDVKKEGDENQIGGNDNEVDEVQMQPAEADTIIETLPICEEEEEKGNEDEPSSSRGTQSAQSTQCIESDHHTNAAVAIAETLPMCEEEEEKGDEEEHEVKPSSSRGTQSAQSTQRLESDHHTHAALAIAETLPMCEEEEENAHEEEHEDEPSSSRGTQSAQSTQRLESDHHTNAALAIAETLPMCEEEEGREEEENENRTQKEEAPKQSVESDKVTCAAVAETLPLCAEDNEGQEEEEEQLNEVMSIKRSSRRRQNPKTKPTKLVMGHVAIPETSLMCDEEEGQEEKPQSEVKPVRKSHRGRRTTNVEATQPLEADSTAEATKMEEEEQDTRRSLRGKRGRETSVKGKGRGRAPVEKDRRGKRGKIEQDEDRDEELDGGNRERGQKNLRQKSKDDEKARLEEKEKNEEARDQLEREESIRLEKERKEREEREKQEQEEKDRLEREKKEREEKEQAEREMKEKEEKERVEREKQLEKERREKDRLEQERIERENKEKEEKEKLEKETRKRRELEEKLERERKEQEEKYRLEREKREREEKEKMEQKEKESKDNNEGVEKEKRQAPGRRKAERKGKKSKKEEETELEEGTEERLDSEQQKKECEESSSKKQENEQAESDSKPRRGRRTARKSLAPPADMEDEGGPAKRTRSRSNSSNSVCSEQSTQDSMNEGIRRGRRRTITAPSSQKEDTKQAVHSRSNSRSSDRSSDSVATQSRGRGAKRRKSVKAEEQEEKVEERKPSAAVGRGRGRGGKRPGANDIKAEAACEAEEEEEESVPAEDSFTSQSSSRGRKRGADVSKTETPQPTPKTPRRSLTGPTHKVLFTGVVVEDGEKVVMHLGGGLAKGVADMTHLVTDKVRRTVKFLCAVARGVPIVTPDWLSKCGKAGSFLSPNGFLVKDVEQEKRFNFSLQDALRVANSQPLLQGYEIHVTPSVKPEPAQMKEIITCCGARFLPKIPSAVKAQTVVVVSCEEDRALCERARSLSFPVVSAEFLLTGILQQKVDLQAHSLPLSPAAAAAPKPNARTRGK
ncbi:mediator of DNA damage checkpoint protein 1 [Hemibagrus wyckioides]|nr:mediator of DNA damage checkpoint protein 1 [Hemibagrus wyckioides]XP_058249450.1 mediator of DNA damage checkpoint protein 1 [Hemibagrus wyckioides]